MAFRPVVRRKRSEYNRLQGTNNDFDATLPEDLMNTMSIQGRNSPSTFETDGSREHLFNNDTNPIFYDFNSALGDLDEHKRSHGERLRRHLQFFFMDPLKKFKIRRQFPFKLAFQILKVFLISYQLILFAKMRISHVDFMEDTVVVMRHKFLRDWDHSRDAIVYPPAAGRYSVFSSSDIIKHMSHIVVAYYSLQNESFASFSYDTSHVQFSSPLGGNFKATEFAKIPPIEICLDRIANVEVENQTWTFDITERTDCIRLDFTREDIANMRKNDTYIATALKHHNITFRPEDALIISKAMLRFNLRTIHYSPDSMDQMPECYLIKVLIEFDNSRHTGQVFITLNSVISYINLCNGRILQVVGVGFDVIKVGTVDILVLILCFSSLILCCRALFKAARLLSATSDFFESVLNQRLEMSDKIEFLNFWYVTIVINDLLVIAGTTSKIIIEFRDFDSDLFTLTGILLGTGALLVYFGLLRYFGFFDQYNILILTLKKSLPSIMRFMICTIILYLGFLFAGWVIIGPYSSKFRSFSGSSEALFSLLNGDDMFATFYTINDNNASIKAFGTVYIYIFVTLFIYVVLSLFIAIIMDAYEVVKQRHNRTHETKRSTLQEFLASSEPPSNLDDDEIRGLFAADQLLRLGFTSVINYVRNKINSLRMRLRPGRSAQEFPYNNFDTPASYNENSNTPSAADPHPNFTMQQLRS